MLGNIVKWFEWPLVRLVLYKHITFTGGMQGYNLVQIVWCTPRLKRPGSGSGSGLKLTLFPLSSLLSPLPRVHPYVWRNFKGEERDYREPGLSVRIPQRSQLYLGDRSRGEEQDPYRFSIFCRGGGI